MILVPNVGWNKTIKVLYGQNVDNFNLRFIIYVSTTLWEPNEASWKPIESYELLIETSWNLKNTLLSNQGKPHENLRGPYEHINKCHRKLMKTSENPINMSLNSFRTLMESPGNFNKHHEPHVISMKLHGIIKEAHKTSWNLIEPVLEDLTICPYKIISLLIICCC